MKRTYILVLSSVSVLAFVHGCNGDDGNADTAVTIGPDTGNSNSGSNTNSGSNSGTGDEEMGETGPCPEITGCLDMPAEENPIGCDSMGNCNLVDMLFVIDNSGTMGAEQLNLAKNFPLLVQQLESIESEGGGMGADVNIMVTTTDHGNPLCKPFAAHDPEAGAPVATSCIERLDRFTGLAQINPPVYEEACTDVCDPPGLKPTNGDLVIHFDDEGNNIPVVPDKDINGDGIEDSSVAQALACVGPQGIDGCGYESPLESMMQALNPYAPWNCGYPDDADLCPNGGVNRPFLREGAVLAVVVITDEADCSVKDYAIMTEDDYFAELDGNLLPSSAICWNAGVTCNGPDQNGIYINCHAEDHGVMHPIARYSDFLNEYVREGLGKEVVMLGILGVPPVTQHAADPPHEPINGGVDDLVYRKWRESDILEEDMLVGIDAAYQEWAFGIGPGCTGIDGMGNVTGQAIPPVRVKEVCESLDYDDNIRCCIESVCDDDFSDALSCLTDVIQNVFTPVE